MNNKQKALSLAKGSYQKDLINGYATIGGSTLKGKAKSYSGRYRKSADNLISRLKQNDVEFEIELGPKGGWYSAVLVFEN